MQIYCVLDSSFYAITFSCKPIVPNIVAFMLLKFSCKYIDPNIVVFMQLHFPANILIVPNIVVFYAFVFHLINSIVILISCKKCLV